MHESVLPKHSLALLTAIGRARAPEFAGWILAGGTGLALQLGHRTSESFGFFRTDAFDVRALHEPLSRLGAYETLQDAEHTLTVLIRNTKLSFFRVREPFLFPPSPHRFFAVADRRDIALMKLAAVAGRGSRKDFVDLYLLLQEPPGLAEVFALLRRKHDPRRLNLYHVLRSLTYFEDAEAEPMPRMLVPFRWPHCKAFFVREARAIVLD